MFSKESRLKNHVSIHCYGSEEIPDVIGCRRQTQGSVASIRIFSHSVHWNEGGDEKNTSCKCLVRNPGLKKDVSMHRYGSEEIPDVIDRRRQTQGSVASTEIFSYSMHWNKGIDDKNTSCKCLVRNPCLEKDVSIHRYGNGETPDVIGCKRQTQKSAA